MRKNTMADLVNCPKEFFTPQQVADVLGCDPQYLRITARQQPQHHHSHGKRRRSMAGRK